MTDWKIYDDCRFTHEVESSAWKNSQQWYSIIM